ncbi:ribonuclease H family protein [Acutalibacter caecimuris]|uniref:ribonuclease H family protein n=1 Tax=Acutalibacter caecimuris TaxID=3093657 RepID=UPI002AC8A8FA|nr:ribonuclease H family protein [Acutalibacter sp. M00118]
MAQAKKKFYAVRVGREGQKIYTSWDACKKQVQGMGGAVYKSFPTLEEAENFLQGWEAGKEPAPETPWDGAVAYVDGSFDKRTGEFSCGAVLFWQGEQVEFSEKFVDPEMAQMHNVAGEIMGVLTVLAYCQEQGIPGVEIHHDYEGLGRWADGSWKANRAGTQRYAAACQAFAQRMKLRFVKVKGHSGDQYNDMADSLARQALGF